MKLFLLLLFASTALASVPCGTRVTAQAGDQGRFKRLIIGGTRINVTKWPWHIQFRVPNGHWCGGTVISDSWILTAAHCFTDVMLQLVRVYAGTQYNSTTEKEELAQRVIAEVQVHPEYDHITNANDIALVKLANPLTNEDAVTPICLPNSIQIIPHDGQVVAVGFGTANEREANGKIIKDGKLRETIMPIVPTEICREKFLATNQSDFYERMTHWNMLVCAGTIGHGAAGGDSGGPLMMKATDGRWFEIGITSFGENDAESLIRADEFPGAFTDVRKYCDWITNTTRGEASCQDEVVHMQDVEIHV